MNNDNWFLIAVVTVAFIVGYSIVSFIVKKVKPQQQTGTPGEGQASQSQEEEEGKPEAWDTKQRGEVRARPWIEYHGYCGRCKASLP